MGKVIDRVKVMNGMKEIIETEGVLTESGHFVVGAVGRMNGKPQWKQSSTPGKQTESRIIMFIDASVATYGENGQGEFVIPIASCRILEIRGSFGKRMMIATPFDNDNDRKQYKNLVVSDEIASALTKACGLASKDAMKAVAEGGSSRVVIAPQEIADEAMELSALADKLASAALAESAKNTANEAPSQNNELAERILNLKKADGK